MNEPVRVAVTGAAGQIGYAAAFRIASGQMFGAQTPVVLHLIEIPQAVEALGGVVMELEDCAFPLLKGVVPTSDLNVGFKGINWALLIGSVPRKAGMERKDLLGINGDIFVGQGRTIQQNAASDVRVLVVGNPCNTNCLIAMNNAPDVPRDRWFAMTRLDENRAKSQLAQRAGTDVTQVERVAIWGNHSATQYPDFTNARVNGKPLAQSIADRAWLENEFLQTVQQRGAAIIKARGMSSAGSAANAIIDSVVSVTTATPGDDWHSVALAADGSYGIPEGLICSFPHAAMAGGCRSCKTFRWMISAVRKWTLRSRNCKKKKRWCRTCCRRSSGAWRNWLETQAGHTTKAPCFFRSKGLLFERLRMSQALTRRRCRRRWWSSRWWCLSWSLPHRYRRNQLYGAAHDGAQHGQKRKTIFQGFHVSLLLLLQEIYNNRPALASLKTGL